MAQPSASVDNVNPTAAPATAAGVTGRVPFHVIAVIVISIALLVVNASLLIINTGATMDSNADYARSYEIKRSLSAFQSVITTAESAQRGYLLTGQTGYLEPYYVAMRSWRKEIGRLRTLTSDDPPRQRDIAELERLTAAAIARLEQTIRSTPQPGPRGNPDVAGTDRATEAWFHLQAQLQAKAATIPNMKQMIDEGRMRLQFRLQLAACALLVAAALQPQLFSVAGGAALAASALLLWANLMAATRRFLRHGGCLA